MAKPKMIGCINAGVMASLYTADGKEVARVFCAPNPLAYAFKDNPEATYALAYYPGDREATRRERTDKDIASRIPSGGYGWSPKTYPTLYQKLG